MIYAHADCQGRPKRKLDILQMEESCGVRREAFGCFFFFFLFREWENWSEDWIRTESEMWSLFRNITPFMNCMKRNNFLATVSHELKTLFFNKMSARLLMLLWGEPNKEQQNYYTAARIMLNDCWITSDCWIWPFWNWYIQLKLQAAFLKPHCAASRQLYCFTHKTGSN